ncbi:MAG: hypothetical protein ACI4EV_04095 [Lachnospiraceae bacterium]
MNTIENAVIIPLFTMIIVAMIIFNLELHNRIVEKSRGYRRDYLMEFENEKAQPDEAIRAYWAIDRLAGKE